jgi:hypothetical protein
MRTSFLFPLTALMAVVTGCGSNAREQATRSVPQRDLTLVPQAPEVQIASPVEIQRLRVQHRTARRSIPFEPKVKLAAVWTPVATLGAGSAPISVAPQPIAQPTSTAETPANDRELLPGKTVTVIPVSSGPSSGPDKADEAPEARGRTMVVGGGGGTCRGRGRGPGIGMGPGPRPDFR